MPVPKVWGQIFMAIFRFSGFLCNNTQILLVCLSVCSTFSQKLQTCAIPNFARVFHILRERQIIATYSFFRLEPVLQHPSVEVIPLCWWNGWHCSVIWRHISPGDIGWVVQSVEECTQKWLQRILLKCLVFVASGGHCVFYCGYCSLYCTLTACQGQYLNENKRDCLVTLPHLAI